MKNLIFLAFNDFRLIFRDQSLRLFIVLPLLNILVVRFGVPYVADIFPILGEYIPYILMAVSVQGALAFGFIYSMVLIDEKDTDVAKVYGILPISQFWFVNFRLFPPFVLSAIATFLVLLFQPFYGIGILPNLIFSALAGLVAPQMVLFVAILSKNKIEGMTWQKLYNIPVILPILAFFISPKFSFLFAIFPTFWVYRAFDNIIDGEIFILNVFIGFIFSLTLIVWLSRKFAGTHFV